NSRKRNSRHCECSDIHSPRPWLLLPALQDSASSAGSCGFLQTLIIVTQHPGSRTRDPNSKDFSRAKAQRMESEQSHRSGWRAHCCRLAVSMSSIMSSSMDDGHRVRARKGPVLPSISGLSDFHQRQMPARKSIIIAKVPEMASDCISPVAATSGSSEQTAQCRLPASSSSTSLLLSSLHSSLSLCLVSSRLDSGQPSHISTSTRHP
ncbi:hypothetical protein CSPX01_01073, partial [Colletotrichum filicis]